MPTQCVTVVYPNQDGSKFDFDYYMQKHIPWVASLVGSKIEVRRGISSAAGSAAPYVCIATIAASIAEFQGGGFSRAAAAEQDQNLASINREIQPTQNFAAA